MKLEDLAKQIFNECEKEGEPVTMEEAIEMAQMEIGAKEVKTVNRSVEPKKDSEKKPKTVQVSQEKQELFSILWEGLSNLYENAQILNQNKLISVQIGEKTFKIDIIEQRKPKK